MKKFKFAKAGNETGKDVNWFQKLSNKSPEKIDNNFRTINN